MAAVSYPVSPARQPFAVLGEARLRTANSIKNQQNGATANSLKRRLDVLDNSDFENIDPLLMGSPSKRNKGGIQLHQDTTDKLHIFTKPAALTVKTPAKARSSSSEFVTPARPIRGQAPLSAPLRAPAGRSPKAKSKSVKAFGRRSLGYCRVDPPAISKRSMSRVPFSIADALNGTFSVSSRPAVEPIPSTTPKTKRPRAWDFEIHADTEQDEMANLMEHSTCVLDISDDEEKQARDNRGKENIPPPQTPADGNNESAVSQQTATATRNVEMGDEPRSPLGELDVKSFIPEGEDVNSVIEIPEDEDEAPAEKTATPVEQCLDVIPKKQLKPSAQPELLSKSAISALLGRTAPKIQVEEPAKKDEAVELAPSAAEIEIWESASVAEEASTTTTEADEPAESTTPSSS